jgi:DNA-binding transcriptional MerR regulator
MELYLTGEAARRAGVHPDSVRSYCREGKVTPQRDSSGRRLFTKEDIKQIRTVYIANQHRIPIKGMTVA